MQEVWKRERLGPGEVAPKAAHAAKWEVGEAFPIAKKVQGIFLAAPAPSRGPRKH